MPENRDWSVVAAEAFEKFAEEHEKRGGKVKASEVQQSLALMQFYATMAIAQQINYLNDMQKISFLAKGPQQ